MIIKSKSELKTVLKEEEQNIFKGKRVTAETKYRSSFKYNYYRYIVSLRTYEYLITKQKNSTGINAVIISQKIKKSSRKLNILSQQTGIDFVPLKVEKNVTVCHPNVILNGTVGEGCIFHGNNVLGNKNTGSDETPVLGKNVDVGTGAIIIGNVTIADNCKIGAGAVVTKSFTNPGTVIVGVPAKAIK